METLTIINSVILFSICCKWLYDNNRIKISYQKTFWCHFIYGISIMWADTPMKYWKTHSHGSRGIFHIRIRDYEKWDKKDSILGRNGEYKKYRKH